MDHTASPVQASSPASPATVLAMYDRFAELLAEPAPPTPLMPRPPAGYDEHTVRSTLRQARASDRALAVRALMAIGAVDELAGRHCPLVAGQCKAPDCVYWVGPRDRGLCIHLASSAASTLRLLEVAR